ncbi:flavodoxin family protein [Pseudomarimonas arenosa]|uniref:Flavodoxin family protein n=1 Tax=Pseudomarimonas arenosa TaxID=2774145 RepID=A0AAW3ZQ48_9GAMM|nr:flavodoxin family protein [Pseudomarimonas arenosa]MBD8528241.1 flavodoxin family protein [Pseudomarimonas arenosa]
MSDRAPRLLIVWHSQTGACEQASACLADAARRARPELDVQRLHADDCNAASVLSSQAIVVVAAENLAALSGRIKDFFDRSYYPLLNKTQGLPFASIICAGSDGDNAQAQLDRIALGLRWRRVAEPVRLMMQAQTEQAILAPKTLSEQQRALCQELGELLAEGLAMQIF